MSKPTESESLFFMERLKELFKEAEGWLPHYAELAELTKKASEEAQQKIAEFGMSLSTSKIDETKLEAFFKKPYYLKQIKSKDERWQLIIPKPFDIQIGWLTESTDSFNVFEVDRTTDLLDELPAALKRELDWKPAPRLEIEGGYLKGSDQELREAWANPNYKPSFERQDREGIKIIPKRAFEIIAALVKDGVKPFKPQPITPDNLRPSIAEVDFDLRDYQIEAWRTFEKYSHVGVFYPPSTGKTYIGMYATAALNPPALIVCPTTLLVEQWEANIEQHTKIPKEDVIVCTYQRAIKKYYNDRFNLLIIDEAHHLPANMFAQLSMLNRNHTIGLTASPFREDGRGNYIYALTGYPIGLRWGFFRDTNLIQNPVCHVWLLKNEAARMSKLEGLLRHEVKTLIFSDGIETGKHVANRFKIPHIYGGTKEGKLKTIEGSLTSVISRVGDEGLSLPALQRVIEWDWLGRSRRQQMQRFTRLLHGQGTRGEHHILMTLPQFNQDRRRFFGIMDKGFKLEIHKEGITDKALAREPNRNQPVKRRVVTRQESNNGQTLSTTIRAEDLPSNNPILRLPAVIRKLETLPQAQAKLYKFLIEKDGEWFKKEKLSLLLGYASENSFKVAVRPSQLVDQNLIEVTKIDKKQAFRTNLAVKVA